MSMSLLICLGLIAGAGAGFLAGLIGIGGGIVVVPVAYYGLVSAGVSANDAAHVAVSTSLAAIVPTAIVSSLAHWRAGNTDFAFLREWGPGIALGVTAAQLTAPHLRGSLLTGVFALFCLTVAARFALPGWFKPLLDEPPRGRFCHIAGAGIGLVSGFAGVGGGILTNVVMTLVGVPMHKSIGRAAAGGVGRQHSRHTGRSNDNDFGKCRQPRQYQSFDVGLHRPGAGHGSMGRSEICAAACCRTS